MVEHDGSTLEFESSLRNVIEKESLRWVFVGGKGGVGKTTTSCCLSIQLARVRESVLVISTDPAHNLSDAFGQKFGRTPTKVNEFDNLFCMEVDSNPAELDALATMDSAIPGMSANAPSFIKDLVSSLPGIQEALSFAELMKQVNTMHYSTIVFDTAPTGHTLQLLALPKSMENTLSKFMSLESSLGPLLSSFFPALSNSGHSLSSSLQEIRQVISQVQATLIDESKCTFVCVCIAEFLSIYETERLVQELTRSHIDCRNLVCNQLLLPEYDTEELVPLLTSSDGLARTVIQKLIARKRMQDGYLSQLLDLYQGFHVTLMPLLDTEVRRKRDLEAFSEMLVNPPQEIILV